MAELLLTQDVDDTHQPLIDTPDKTRIWGRLLPLRSRLPAVELTDECYMFGRGDECSVILYACMFEDEKQFNTLSKKHFKIFLEVSSHGQMVFIQDLSTNGTFVNGVKIGCGDVQPLNNNDEVSLSLKYNKCYVFSDSKSNQDGYPFEVTSLFTVSKLIGRGACGEVRLVFEKGSCQKRAMKIVQKKNFFACSNPENASRKQVESEVNIMTRLKHPNIIQIYGMINTQEAVYMVLELVEGGELFDRIVSLGHLSESDAKFFFLQVAIAVEYLHKHGITHRDLKPENILLASSERHCLLKVTDFGLSKFVDGNTMLRTFCGTPTYLAPEVLQTAGSGTYTSSIDVWSLGVILYVCLVGYPPFTEQRTDHDLHTQIVEGLFDFPAPYWSNVSAEAKDLVRKMLTVDPSKRLTIQAVLDHPWLDDPPIRRDVHALLSAASVGETVTKTSDLSTCVDENRVSSISAAAVDEIQSLLKDRPLILKRPMTIGSPPCSHKRALF